MSLNICYATKLCPHIYLRDINIVLFMHGGF